MDTSGFRQELHDMWEVVKEERSAVAEVKTELASLSTQVGMLVQVVTKIDSEQANRGKTPWANYLAALALSATLGGAILTAALAPLYLLANVQAESLEKAQATLIREIELRDRLYEAERNFIQSQVTAIRNEQSARTQRVYEKGPQ